MRIRIAITDDHPLVLQGIKSMLDETKEVAVVGSFSNGQKTKIFRWLFVLINKKGLR